MDCKLTSHVCDHLSILDARTFKQGDLCSLIVPRLIIPLAQSRRKSDVLPTRISVYDEDVGTYHPVSLPQGDPLLRGRALDLEKYVAVAAGGCGIWDVDSITDGA